MAVSVCNVLTDPKEKETTPHGRADFPVACYEDDMQVLNVPLHWHEEYEYIIAVKGIVTVCVNTGQLKLQEGDAVFINSGCLHGVLPSGRQVSVLRSLVFLPRLIGGSSDSVLFHKLIVPLSGREAPPYLLLSRAPGWQTDLNHAMLSAWQALSEEVYDFENETRYLLSRALRLLVDHLPELAAPPRSNDLLLEHMKRSLRYIEEHYMEDISNRDLMDVCHCSESALLRNFRSVTGCPPMQYLLRFRMQKAAELLLTTDMKSCDIGEACGFHDFSYFTRLFRRYSGRTPIAYREAGGLPSNAQEASEAADRL